MSQAEEDHRVRERGWGGTPPPSVHPEGGTVPTSTWGPQEALQPVSGLRSSFVTVGFSAAFLSRGTARGSAWGGFSQAAMMGSHVPHLLRGVSRPILEGRQALPRPPHPGGPHRSPDWVMSRRQVSICTSKPRFMLHISMYSCRWRFMSFLAVASSSCRGRAVRSAAPPARTPRRPTRHTVKEVKGSDSKLNQLEAKGTRYANIPSMFPGEAHPQKAFAKESVAGGPSSLKRL